MLNIKLTGKGGFPKKNVRGDITMHIFWKIKTIVPQLKKL